MITAATWADPDDPAYLELLHNGAVTITTISLPLQTPVGLSTGFYLWQCPACPRINEMDRAHHPATCPALVGGHPGMFRAPFDSSQVLCCDCGACWIPQMLAPYDREIDEYRLVCNSASADSLRHVD